MKEEFLHFVWKNNLYANIVPIDSSIDVDVKDAGIHNRDAGPDFFNSKIRLGETIWAGNVEIHLKSSDWEKHGHHKDKSYNNVILHLVNEFDKEVFHENKKRVFTALINVNSELYTNYKNLISSNRVIPCSDVLKTVDDLTIKLWLTNLLIERIETKTEYIKSLLNYTKNSWEEAFYISLAKSFGFNVNSLPFELTAKSLPILIPAKNKNELIKIEALFFGQAGFLEDDIKGDEYFDELKRHYQFLKIKYKLKPIEKHLWKFLRIRPANFPTIRIAQFASLVYRSSHLFSKILEAINLNEMICLLTPETNTYWKTHFQFGQESTHNYQKMGKQTIENIIINTILPFIFLFGKEKDYEKYINRALSFYEEIKPESNHIIKNWIEIGIKPLSANDSQSLIHLYNSYCRSKRCIDCKIGGKIVTMK